MQCLTVPDDDHQHRTNQQHVDDGEAVYCLNRHVLSSTQSLSQAVKACTDEKGVVGGKMDAGCANVWHERLDNVKSYLPNVTTEDNHTNYPTKYCYGATGMYMHGFEWEGQTCLVYLFSDLVIHSRSWLVLACFTTIVFGVAVELVMKQRRMFVANRLFGFPTYQRLALAGLSYAVQLTMGYAIMLLVMTYSGPLVLSVVTGLMLGHVLVNWDTLTDKHKHDATEQRQPSSSSLRNHSTVSNDHGERQSQQHRRRKQTSMDLLTQTGGTTPCCLTPSGGGTTPASNQHSNRTMTFGTSVVDDRTQSDGAAAAHKDLVLLKGTSTTDEETDYTDDITEDCCQCA